MKKLLLLAVAAVFAVTSTYATFSRINGLGIEPWMIEEDDTLIWNNTARLSDYKNIIWGELGIAPPIPRSVTTSNLTTLWGQWGAVSYGFELGFPSVIGVAIARPYTGRVGTVGQDIGDVDPPGSTGLPAMSRNVTVPPGTPPVTLATLSPLNKIDLGYSIALLDNLKLGAGINLADNYDNREFSFDGAATSGTVTNNRASKDTNISIGALINGLGPISKLDVALTLGMPSVKNTFKETPKTPGIDSDDHELKTDGAMNLGLFTRGVVDLSDISKLLLAVNYSLSDLPNTYIGKNDANADGDYTDDGEWVEQKRTQQTSTIALGSALNKKINDKTLLILALGISQTTTKNSAVQSSSAGITTEEYKEEITGMTVPVNIALERELSKLLTARLGVRYNILSTEKTEVTDPDNFDPAGKATREGKSTTVVDLSGTQATVSLGVGVNVTNSLKLDAVVRQQVLFTGTYIISGVPETLATQLTATYKF